MRNQWRLLKTSLICKILLILLSSHVLASEEFFINVPLSPAAQRSDHAHQYYSTSSHWDIDLSQGAINPDIFSLTNPNGNYQEYLEDHREKNFLTAVLQKLLDQEVLLQGHSLKLPPTFEQYALRLILVQFLTDQEVESHQFLISNRELFRRLKEAVGGQQVDLTIRWDYCERGLFSMCSELQRNYNFSLNHLEIRFLENEFPQNWRDFSQALAEKIRPTYLNTIREKVLIKLAQESSFHLFQRAQFINMGELKNLYNLVKGNVFAIEQLTAQVTLYRFEKNTESEELIRQLMGDSQRWVSQLSRLRTSEREGFIMRKREELERTLSESGIATISKSFQQGQEYQDELDRVIKSWLEQVSYRPLPFQGRPVQMDDYYYYAIVNSSSRELVGYQDFDDTDVQFILRDTYQEKYFNLAIMRQLREMVRSYLRSEDIGCYYPSRPLLCSQINSGDPKLWEHLFDVIWYDIDLVRRNNFVRDFDDRNIAIVRGNRLINLYRSPR